MLKELLSKIQTELNVPKGRENKFGGFFYRSCEDILDKVKPLLAREGITLVLADEIVEIGSRYYVRAYATLYFKDELLTVCAYAREQESKTKMDDCQVTGASSSYARKYALNGMFLIDDARDADAADNTTTAPAAAKTTTSKTEAVEVADVIEATLREMKVKDIISKKSGKPYKIAQYVFTEDGGKTFETISSFDVKAAAVGDAMRFVGVTKNEHGLSAKMVEVVKGSTYTEVYE